MTLKDTLRAAAIIIKKKANENPSGGVKRGGKLITYEVLCSALKSVSEWCYDGEMDIVQVVRCKNCMNYKHYKHTSNPRDKGCMCCRLDKQKKPPEHYCAFGEQGDTDGSGSN